MATPFKEQEKEIDKQAKARAELIDKSVQEFLKILVANDMTVNDFEVCIEDCRMRLQGVYRGKKVADLM